MVVKVLGSRFGQKPSAGWKTESRS